MSWFYNRYNIAFNDLHIAVSFYIMMIAFQINGTFFSNYCNKSSVCDFLKAVYLFLIFFLNIMLCI